MKTYPEWIALALDTLDFPVELRESVLGKACALRVDLAQDQEWQQDMKEAFESTQARLVAVHFLAGLSETFPKLDPVGIQLRAFLDRA